MRRPPSDSRPPLPGCVPNDAKLPKHTRQTVAPRQASRSIPCLFAGHSHLQLDFTGRICIHRCSQPPSLSGRTRNSLLSVLSTSVPHSPCVACSTALNSLKLAHGQTFRIWRSHSSQLRRSLALVFPVVPSSCSALRAWRWKKKGRKGLVKEVLHLLAPRDNAGPELLHFSSAGYIHPF